MREYETCPCCGGKIKRYRVTLSKNLIRLLQVVYMMSRKDGYVETKNLYDKSHGSATGHMTMLRYLGLAEQHFTYEDTLKKSQRSGKWKVTYIGNEFLQGKIPISSYVVVENQKVIEYGVNIFINDPLLKWMTEDDIWEAMKVD